VAHAKAAKEAGLTEEEIDLARKAGAHEAKAEALLRFTQEVVLQRGKISDEDYCAVLRAGFSQGELVEIIGNIALNIFTNYLNLVAKTEVNFPMPQVVAAK
jgi:alkylhydroperoxidase family enzyme